MAALNLPPAVSRRFEGLITVGGGIHKSDAAAVACGQLLDAGVLVGIVDTATVADTVARVRREGVAGGVLLVAGDGDELAVAEGAAVRHVDNGDDALSWMLHELWLRGVGPADTLIIIEGSDRLVVLHDSVMSSEVAQATIAMAGMARTDAETQLSADVAWIGADPEAVVRVLRDQHRRRRDGEIPSVIPLAGWDLTLDAFDPVRERVNEALFALADGRIGTSGAPVVAHEGTYPWVLVSGIYDGEGPETSLLEGPTGLRLPYGTGSPPQLRRVLDLHTGMLREDLMSDRGPVTSVRFSSLARPGTVVLRARCPDQPEGAVPLLPPADHHPHDQGSAADGTWMRMAATSGGVAAAAAQATVSGQEGNNVDRVVVYDGDPDLLPDPAGPLGRVRDAMRTGFDRLAAEHRRAWAERWEDADVVIEGDDELQRSVRFALFQLMGSVADTDEAAVGARGISGQGYRGHVFWDADTFVLPFLAATHPASARAMLEYRLRRLPAALAAARAAGRSGARYPWESARSGFDVTPTVARDRAGKVVPIRTGLLEEHIAADIAWAACCYTDWTGDHAFARGPGTRLLVETARYWASRVRVEADGTAHIYGVIGPDEYHETVDDNAYTNVMARWNLRRAAAAVDATSGHSDNGRDVQKAEVARWRDIADALVDGYDADTGIYEQCSGFSKLEPLVIEEVAPRRPIAADLLLGAQRVQGAQVLKQADVLMLHHLVPDEVAPDSLEPNLRYYEPRTAHGSSLSPAVHASLFARARDFEHALEALNIAARIDLDDLTGTTAGGLHVATMGGLWQALAFGFAGLRPRDGRLEVDPRLPPSWAALEIRVRFRGSRLRMRKERNTLHLTADPSADVAVGGHPYTAGPTGIAFRRRGSAWELIR